MGDEEIHLQPGDKVDGRWQVIRTLGEGAFGAVYEAIDSKGELEGSMALKLESTVAKVQLLKIEVSVCRDLQGTAHVTHLFACGRNNKYNFMLMSMLGPSLANLRRKAPRQTFSFSTATRVAYNCMKAIKSMHEAGWLHRDIKPANFAIGSTPDTASAIFVFDFGLCRKFHSKAEEAAAAVRPARAAVGFRGTMRYCSMNAHRRIELGRHDDLISVSYMLVEMAKGELPWKALQDGDDVYKSKLETDKDLYNKLPKNLYVVHQYLHTLRYEDKPKYNMFEETLLEIIYTMSFHTEPMDWEKKKGPPTPSLKPADTPKAAVAKTTDKPNEKPSISTKKLAKTDKEVNPKADTNVDKEDQVDELPATKYHEQ